MTHLLRSRNVPHNIVKTIENIYTRNYIEARIGSDTTEPIPVMTGIRQGDSLSPLLFNIVMDEVIKSVRSERGYRMGNQQIGILCYADDAVLIAESEDDLQRMLHKFNTTARQYIMIISTEKTKTIVITKEPIRCKLEIENKIIEQLMDFKYLGINLSSYGDLVSEVKEQVTKASRVAGCLNDTIWRNRYL